MGSMDCFVKNDKDLKSTVSNVVSSTINDDISGIVMFTYISMYVYVGIHMCMDYFVTKDKYLKSAVSNIAPLANMNGIAAGIHK
jgi:hypothetical protein